MGGYTGVFMIDEQLAGFLQEGLAIHLGTRNKGLQPNGGRAVAVRVEADRVHVVVYMAQAAAERLLGDLETNGQAAVVFCRPIDDRACQVKGVCVGVRPAMAEERAFVAAQWDRFLVQLEQIGIPRAVAGGWITWPAVAIRLQTTALFNQTPGPDAGAAL
jgi:hypothetical protein